MAGEKIPHEWYFSILVAMPTTRVLTVYCYVLTHGGKGCLHTPIATGKTSTLSMLMGLLEPTSGTATVAGLDLRRDLRAIHTVMGVCPQFDVLWNELTAREHLSFYGRCAATTLALGDEHAQCVNTLHVQHPQAQGSPARHAGGSHHRGTAIGQAAAQGRRTSGGV